MTNVYRTTRDLVLAQRFARHVSPLTTVVYTHPSDEEMRDRLRELGYGFVGPDEGDLACGEGPGRFAEPEAIMPWARLAA